MLEPLTTLVIRPKYSPYLGGLLRFVCIYGVYLHLSIFIFGSSTLIFTNPISCSVPKGHSFTESYVNTRCANKPLLELEETEWKAIAEKREKLEQEELKKQADARGGHGKGRNGRKKKSPLFVPGNNDETANMVLYYRYVLNEIYFTISPY